MGRPRQLNRVPTLAECLEHHRVTVLALIAEATEVLNVVPWKPWKNYEDNNINRAHIAEELADIIFFVTALMTNWDISPAQLEQAIIDKLAENMRRIHNGYSKTL